MEFLSKKLFSKKYEEADEEWIEVKLTRDEYFNLKTQLKTLNSSVSSLKNKKSELENSIMAKDKELESSKEKNKILDSEILRVKSEISRVYEDNSILKEENSTLNSKYKKALQISKERANAIRNLSPKKKNTGFRLLNLKEAGFYKNIKIEETVGSGFNKKKITSYKEVYIRYYKYQIELPIFSSFNFEEAKDMFYQDLKKYFDLEVTISKIETINNTDNYVFNFEFSCSEKSNFYQVDFITTKFLDLEKLNFPKK